MRGWLVGISTGLLVFVVLTTPGISATAQQELTNEACLLCHATAEVVESATIAPRPELVVDPADLAASVHADFDCTFCHEEIVDIPHEPRLAAVDPEVCSLCHEDAFEAYSPSVHGEAWAQNDGDAPRCSDCHGIHDIRAIDDHDSAVYPFALPETCGRCHGNERIAQQHAMSIPDAYQRYVESVHGRGLLRAGLLVSASCNDCHDAHAVFPVDDPRSPVFRGNQPATCGQCHEGILTEFSGSIHGTLLAAGNEDAPSCTDCHATHAIPEAFEPTFIAAATAECGGCHVEKLDTYRGTYHGKVNQLGFTGVAACSSCHTAHGILPASEPLSSIAPANLTETCGACHVGANGKFASYIVHADPTDFERFPLLFTIYFGMLGLLTAVLIGASAHTALWYRRLRIEQRELGEEYRRSEYWKPGGKPEYVRFNVFNRVLHILVMVSFLLLVATGIPVRFAHTEWASNLVRLFGGFRSAAFAHRVGGGIIVVYVVMHLGYLAYLRWGKGQRNIIFGADTLVPNRRDWREFVGHVRWFLGRGPKPQFGRWTYWEKFDYLADAWGVVIFGTTGLLLWFPVFFTHWLPGWTINVAIIVHGFEALLALTFIFTVHFFNAHLRPGKFPLDPVFLTGRITVEELENERPREYRQLVAEKRLDEELVEPSSLLAHHYARVVGYAALTIGLLLVALVVLSVVATLLNGPR